MTQEKRRKLGVWVRVMIAAAVTMLQIIPLVVVVINSLRGNDEIAKIMIALPRKLHFGNYLTAWERGGYAHAYASSLIIGFGTSVSVAVLVGFAVYGLLKTDCFGKNF